MPAYVLALLYSAIALLFPDRWIYLLGLALALVLYSGAWRFGGIIASNLLHVKDETIYFPLGLGLFLLLAYIVAVVSTGPVLYGFWVIAGILSIFQSRILFQKFPLSFLFGFPFILLGFWSSFTPSVFFDTLVYHLGLPMQDLLTGKMQTLPYHFFSTFPPFEFVLNLLFVKLNAFSGIKIFSILLVFHIAYILTDLTSNLLKEGSNHSLKSKFVVLPVIFLASIWIQVHLVTADLLVAMFLISAISYMIKNRASVEHHQVIAVAFLAAWAGWTKPTALPYMLLTASLWFPLKLVQLNFRKFILLFGIIFVLICPILIRNYIVTTDPLYPTLSKALKNPNWSLQQQLAWEVDHTSPKQEKMIRILKAPIEIVLKPFKYGSAAEIGILYVLGLTAYLFYWKKHPRVSRLLVFLMLCYVAWSFLFRDFRQFFPVFLLIHVPCAVALHNLLTYKKWIPSAILTASAIFSIHLLLPVFQSHIPMLRVNQTQEMYLEKNLDYYPLAKWSGSIQKSGKMLMLGETRVAYLNVPVIATTAFDKHPFFIWLSQASTPLDLQKHFINSNINYMMVNWDEYARFAEKCGILPIDPVPPRFRDIFKKGKARTGVPLAHLTKREMEILSQFSKSCLVPKWRIGDQYLVWEVRCEDLPQRTQSSPN